MQKYALKIAVMLFGFSAGLVNALGIGSIEAETALNEPLKATILLRDTSGVRSDEIEVSLAPVSDFRTTGIDYVAFLTDFKFEVLGDKNNRPLAVLITSSKPIREPYVNFLMSVRWPNGRLLKEYTVLLDPIFSGGNLVSSSRPIAQQIKSGSSSNRIVQQQDTRTKPSERLNSANDSPSRVTILRNDTLWEIAERVSPAGVSVHQTMHALKRENPNAFINDNINQIKAGYVLNVPTADEIRQFDANRAAQATRQDYNQWTSSKSNTSSVAQVASGAPQGELTLASANDIASTDAAALEKISALQSENTELNDRVQSLEQQLNDLNRLLQLKNSQLAVVQQQSVDVLEQQAEPVSDASTNEAEAESVTSSDSEQVAQAGIAAEMTAIKGAAPIELTPEQPLWLNPIYQLAGLSAILVALIIGLLIARRKPQRESVELDDVGIILDSGADDSVEDDLDEIIELPDDAAVSSDQLEELADEYIGVSYAEVKTAIEQRLDSEAHRADLQVFLLQQAAINDDRDTFVSHFRAFEAIGKAADIEKASAILKAIRGNTDWLNAEAEPMDIDLAAPDEESDEFFKDIVHEEELTDEIAALLEASEGTTSLDQADIDDVEFESLTAVDDEPLVSDDTMEFNVEDFSAAEQSQVADEQVEDSQVEEDDGLDFDIDDLDFGASTDSEQEAAAVDEDDFDSVESLDFEATLQTSSDESFDDTVIIAPSETEEESLDFEAVSDESGADESFDDLDSLLDGLDLDEGGEDVIAEPVQEAPEQADAVEDLLSEMSFEDDEVIDAESDSDEMLLKDDAPEASSEEGDIIDLSDFLDGADDLGFDEADLSVAEEEDEALDNTGSDDFDDLDDLSSLLDDNDADIDLDEELNTKLGMAEAFIEMGDVAAAKEALNEVIDGGESHQREAARSLLAKLGG